MDKCFVFSFSDLGCVELQQTVAHFAAAPHNPVRLLCSRFAFGCWQDTSPCVRALCGYSELPRDTEVLSRRISKTSTGTDVGRRRFRSEAAHCVSKEAPWPQRTLTRAKALTAERAENTALFSGAEIFAKVRTTASSKPAFFATSATVAACANRVRAAVAVARNGGEVVMMEHSTNNHL